MKRLLLGMVLVVLTAFYLFVNDEEALTMEENQTIISPPQVKKVTETTPIPAIEPTREEIEEEEQNTTAPNLCLKYKTEGKVGEKYELDDLGRVKSVTRDANSDGEVEKKSLLSYDEFGNLVKVLTEIYQEPEKLYEDSFLGLVYSFGEYKPTLIKTIEHSRSYDTQNRLTEKFTEYPTYSSLMTFEYGDGSEPIDVQIFQDDELVVRFKGLHEYDNKGRLIHRKYKAIEASQKIIWMSRMNPELGEESYIYNDQDQLIRVEDHGYHRFFEYQYDEKGNRIHEGVYHRRYGGVIKKFDEILYKYDTYGNLLEKVNSNGDVLLKQEFGVCEE